MTRKNKTIPSTEQIVEIHRRSHPRDEMTVESVEIVRVETDLVAKQRADFRAMMDEIVRAKVEEALAERGEADFQTREVVIELKRPKTVWDRVKWKMYFSRWGCIRCEKKDDEVNHGSLGLCTACAMHVNQRMPKLKKGFEMSRPDVQIQKDIDHLTGRLRTAKSLLGDE